MRMKIHLSAIIHPHAEIPNTVEIGPYCIVGDKVKIGDGTRLLSHVVIEGPTVIGDNNIFSSFSSIGSIPQDLKYNGEASRLEIGHRNTIREFVTINRGTEEGGLLTRVGDNNFIMAYTHIGHDCLVGNDTIFGNAATLAGHVLVEDGAAIGAHSGVHQFCRVGVQAFVGGYSVITRDALPYVKTVGSRGVAKTYGINSIGLQRRNYGSRQIDALKHAYRALFHSKTPLPDALESLKRLRQSLDS